MGSRNWDPARRFKRLRGGFLVRSASMTHVPFNDELLKNLNGKVAIITGTPPSHTQS